MAHELLAQLGHHRDELTELFGAEPVIVAPYTVSRDVDAILPFRLERRSVLSWQFWEQLELPVRARNAVLLNLCNLAPMMHGRSITMIHDAQTFSSPQSYSFLFRNYYQAVLPIIGRRALRILTVSRYSAQQLDHYGIAPYGDVDVVHNGVDHRNMASAAPHAPQSVGATPRRYVLALAAAQAHKNIGVLLRAFADPAMADLKLVLFGKGSADAFARQGIPVPPNVIFAGRVDDTTLAGLMRDALCFAMPSRTEGFGLPPLEAMLRGSPAVIAPCGALAEVCGEGAIHADVDSPAAWREAILRLANSDEEHARWSAKGLAQAKRMSWAAAGDRLMATLRVAAAQVQREAVKDEASAGVRA